MADVKLYIQGNLCDLSGKETIEVDYTNFDILKIDSRGGARSYSFNLPKTNRNKQVLENPEMISNLSNVPYLRMRCELLVDGVDTLIRFCEVSSVKDSYKINLYGANSDVFAEIKDLKLSELDFSDYDHFWNFDNVFDGMYRTSVYGYGVIDFHADSPNFAITDDDIYADYLLPFMYQNAVLEKVFENLGYTVTNTIESDTTDLIVPKVWQVLRDTNPRRYEAVFSLNMVPINGSDGLSILGTPPYGDSKLIFNILDSTNGNFFLNGTNLVDTNHYFGDGVTLDVLFELTVENNLASNIDLTIKCNYSVLNNTATPIQFTVTVAPGTSSISQTVTIPLEPVTGYSPSFAYLNFTAHSSAGVIATQVKILNGSRATFQNVTITKPYNVTYGQSSAFDKFNYMTVSSLLPDWTQMEFLTNYMQMFCLYPVVDEVNKSVVLKKFDSLVESGNGVLDWSEKIDLSEEPEIKFIQSAYAQHNKFVYTQDGEEGKPTGTDGEITINNQNLEFEKTSVELKYAATNANLRMIDNLIAQIGIFVEGVYTNEKEPRILNLRRTLNGTKNLKDDYSNTAVLSGAVNIPYFIDAQQTLNLGFSDNLLPNYYQVLTDVLGRVKIVNQLVRLSAADVSLIDFSKIVWIAKYESYFYINSIKGFSLTESKSTLVELVKLNING